MHDAEFDSLVPEVLPAEAEHFEGLTPQDGFVLSLVDGRRTIADIVAECPLGDEDVHGSLRKLLYGGALRAPGYCAAGANVATEPEDLPEPEVAATTSAESPAAGPPVPWIQQAMQAAGEEPLPALKHDEPPVETEAPVVVLETRSPVRVARSRSAKPAPAPVVSPTRQVAVSGVAPMGEVIELFVATGEEVTGDFKDKPVYRLLRELYDEQQSGVLTVHHRGGGPWILYVYEGHPQYVVEPDPQHRLGEALAHSGLVSPEDVERAVELGERENRRIGLALAQLGLLTEYQLRGILRTLVEVRLGSFFEMDRGEWSFVRDDRSRRDLVLTRIDMARVIFGGLKDHFAWDVARDNLLADQDRFLRRNPEMEEQLLGLKLSPKELRFAQDVIDGTKTLRQVLGYSTLKASETYQMVHALVATGFLHLTGEALATAREGQVADDLGHKIRTLRGANHFDVLEIHWSCIEDDVQKAYERLKREYGPEGKWVKGAPDLEKMSAEILAAVEVSYRAVIHQSDRRSYRRELISPEKIGYAVEFNLGQAKNHRFTEDLPAMAECLERVKELSPGTSTEI